jgi:hypothetical protein
MPCREIHQWNEDEARSVLIAAGTQPNTVLAREEGVSLALDGKYFLACDEPARR